MSLTASLVHCPRPPAPGLAPRQTEPSVEPRPVVLDRTLQSLKALYNVFKIFPDGVSQTINRYKVLFYFFRVDESPEIQQATLAVVHLIVANKVGPGPRQRMQT